jgi:hypothetical protein
MRFAGIVGLLAIGAAATACSSILPPTDQSQLATRTEEVEKLKSAEYQYYMSAMSFEDNNQKLGNYYAEKGAKTHQLIDQLEKGQPVDNKEINRALDTSDAEKYDNRPPVPLDDELGNGY